MNDQRVPGDVLLHPLTLAALALWVVNDHALKHAFPGVWTGKLSDVACLIVCPLLTVAAAELIRPELSPTGRRRVLLGAMLVFGAIMCCIRVWPLAADAYRYGLGAAQWCVRAMLSVIAREPLPRLLPVRLAMDPTDIATLPSLLVAWLIAQRTGARSALCRRRA